MKTQGFLTAVMAGCAAVVLSGSAPGLAQQMPQMPQHMAADAHAPSMAAKCEAMVAEREKMMADMKAADQRLDGLVAKMNTAVGMEKMAPTSKVVAEMVTQDRTMRDGMMKMQQDMMAHMMEHMQAGKDSIADCPMMMMMMKMMTPMGAVKH